MTGSKLGDGGATEIGSVAVGLPCASPTMLGCCGMRLAAPAWMFSPPSTSFPLKACFSDTDSSANFVVFTDEIAHMTMNSAISSVIMSA